MSEFMNSGDSPLLSRKPQVYYQAAEVFSTYTSIYGYKKNRIEVTKHVGESDEEGIHAGSIKQEPVVGANGVVTGYVYYERNGWKKHGQLRFYATPDALLEAMGFALKKSTDAFFTSLIPGADGLPQQKGDIDEAVVLGAVPDAFAPAMVAGSLVSEVPEPNTGIIDIAKAPDITQFQELAAPTMADMQSMTDAVASDPVALADFMEKNPLPAAELGITEAEPISPASDEFDSPNVPGEFAS